MQRESKVSSEARPLVTSVNAACLMLDCGRDEVYELIRDGEIDSFLDGRRRKIVVASVENYIVKRVKASKKFERGRYAVRGPDGVVQAGIGAKQSVTAS